MVFLTTYHPPLVHSFSPALKIAYSTPHCVLPAVAATSSKLRDRWDRLQMLLEVELFA